MRAGVVRRPTQNDSTTASAAVDHYRALITPLRERSATSTRRWPPRWCPARANTCLATIASSLPARSEALAWWKYSKDIGERSAQEEQFKDLAKRVARVHFSTVLPDDDWAYYERMRDYKESGEYSKTTSGPVVPETDTSTYNGMRWATLQGIYPTYAEALAKYEQVAIKPEFRWSWRNHQLEYDIFKRETDKRNDANRAAIRDLLVVGAESHLEHGGCVHDDAAPVSVGSER